MGYETLSVGTEGGVALVTITRPDRLNALDDATLVELTAAFRALRDDGTVRCVILTGGPAKRPAFVAGADIGEMAGQTPAEGRARSLLGQALCDLIENLGKPVIAAVNGVALGGGLELALACHFRLASTDARLGLPEVTLGIIPGFGGTQRLPRAIGLGPALELLTSGRHADAAEALRLGLVNQVYPPEQLLPECRKLAAKIAGNAPVAVRLALEAALAGRSQPLSEGLRLEATLFGLISATHDTQEGLKAFLDKRPPQYRGS
ncbi:MAG: enoyl-CoA hydratase/isomerase family protein [Planctomycetaceae bacterium]